MKNRNNLDRKIKEYFKENNIKHDNVYSKLFISNLAITPNYIVVLNNNLIYVFDRSMNYLFARKLKHKAHSFICKNNIYDYDNIGDYIVYSNNHHTYFFNLDDDCEIEIYDYSLFLDEYKMPIQIKIENNDIYFNDEIVYSNDSLHSEITGYHFRENIPSFNFIDLKNGTYEKEISINNKKEIILDGLKKMAHYIYYEHRDSCYYLYDSIKKQKSFIKMPRNVDINLHYAHNFGIVRDEFGEQKYYVSALFKAPTYSVLNQEMNISKYLFFIKKETCELFYQKIHLSELNFINMNGGDIYLEYFQNSKSNIYCKKEFKESELIKLECMEVD